MMNTAMITAGQAARAMGLDEKEMAVLLNESGVCTANGLLTPADTETLLSYLAGQQEDSRRRAQENLERLSARYAFLIDTCSLLDEHFPALVEHLMPLLEANGKKLFVPSGVPAELRQFLLSGVRDSIQHRAEALGAEKNDLACTLLAVAVRGDAYLLFHVGDGVIGYRKSGKLLVASAPQNGEFANMTTFVTSPDALLHSRALRGIQPQIEGFVLMSDGCEAALYHKGRNRLAPLIHKIFQRLQLLSSEASQMMMMGAVMEHAIAERTQDDCSMALLVRKTNPFDAWLQITQREKAHVPGIATGNRNRCRRAIRQYAYDELQCNALRPERPGGQPDASRTGAAVSGYQRIHGGRPHSRAEPWRSAVPDRDEGRRSDALLRGDCGGGVQRQRKLRGRFRHSGQTAGAGNGSRGNDLHG